MISIPSQLPIFVAIGSSLLTAFVTLSSVLLANRSNLLKSKFDQELSNKFKTAFYKNEKLEQLFILFDKWSKFVLTNWINYASVMDGSLTLKQLNELVIKHSENSEIEHSRIEMIIRLYFPELKQSYNKLNEQKTFANKYMLSFRNEYLKGNTDGKKYLPDFLHAQSLFDSFCEEFKKDMEKLIKC